MEVVFNFIDYKVIWDFVRQVNVEIELLRFQ